jgi:hypothetical protein
MRALPGATLLLAALLGAGCSAALSSARSPGPTAADARPLGGVSGRPAAGGALQGMYEFAGANSSGDAGNPDLAGVVLVYYWRQLEPVRGQDDWSLVTRQMAPWVAAGKRVVLRVSASGQPAWQPPDSAHATPGWVYHDGARVVHDEGASVPVYWSPAFLSDYLDFVTAFGRRFGGDPGVAFVEAGIGMGGETLPDTLPDAAHLGAWWSAGYSDARWLATIEQITTAYRHAFAGTPVYVMLDHAFLDRSATYYRRLLGWLVGATPPFGLQFNGLSSRVRLPAGWPAGIAAEQFQSATASGDRLCADLEHGIALGARYLLVFRSDVDRNGNGPCLHHVARLAGTVPS